MSGPVTHTARAGRPPGRVDVLELARELIRTPSPNPPGDERAVAGLLREALTTHRLPAGQIVARDDKRPNLIVTLDFGSGGRHLVLSGHTDTKPVGDARWSVDPFAATVDGDRLYGLGSADMKAALAAVIAAAVMVAETPPSHGRLSLVLTADEEDGARFGAHHLAQTTHLNADGAVIGEPGGMDRDFDRLHLVSRGIARLRLIAHGSQAHSSLSGRPGRRNAGLDAARATVAVADDLRPSTPPNPGNLAGWEATVNTGLAFRGGVGYGVLPGVMAVDTEVRLLPGMRREQVRAELEAVARSVNEARGADVRVAFDSPPHDWLPASLVASDDPLAVAARDACRAVLGTVPADSVFPGTTDATWFHQMQGMPTLPALGPGLLLRAHAADEWVSIDAVNRATTLYAELARTFCQGVASTEPERGSQA
jgi:acetylornithine deacetylase/succinyl-diaminopimelate desuccinylase-like protein